MRIILSLLILLTALNSTIAQTTAIPDANFEQALIDLGYDSGSPDGVVLTSNIDTVTVLNVYSLAIADLTGIEEFTALKQLKCFNNGLTSIDVSQNTTLTYLNIHSNNLTNLDISLNPQLTYVNFDNNNITNIDVAQNTSLAPSRDLCAPKRDLYARCR